MLSIWWVNIEKSGGVGKPCWGNIYIFTRMSPLHKPMAWLTGEPKTPPIPSDVRIEAGYLFRLVQAGMLIPMPESEVELCKKRLKEYLTLKGGSK